MMVKHLPYNEFDMCAITNAVNRYKAAGLRADYNIEQKAAGVVSIVLEKPNDAKRVFSIIRSAQVGSAYLVRTKSAVGSAVVVAATGRKGGRKARVCHGKDAGSRIDRS
jgi:hypothetical protein